MSWDFFVNALNGGAIPMPNDYYRALEQAHIDNQWENTTALEDILEQDVDEQGHFVLWEYHKTQAWLNTIVGMSSTGSKSGKDFLQLIFQDLTHTLEEGRYYQIKGFTWLSYFDNSIADVIAHLAVRRCNNHLRLRDPLNGSVVSFPCVVGYDMAAATPQVTTAIITPNNHATVLVQGNKETLRLFKTNTRVILSGRPFKLTGIQNTLEENVGIKHTSLLTLEFFLDELHANDDLENGVADNGEYDYDIHINGEDMELAVGANGVLTASVTLNGVEVSRMVSWESSNEDVVVIDSDGNYQVVGAVDDVATISAYMQGNPAMRSSIEIRIVSSIVDTPELIVEPIIDTVREQQTVSFAVTLFANGVSVVPTNLTCSSPSWTNTHATVTVNGNIVSITCLKLAMQPMELYLEGSDSNSGWSSSKTINIKLVSLLG